MVSKIIKTTIEEVTWILNENDLSFEDLFEVASALIGTLIYNNMNRADGDLLVNVLSEGLKKGGKKIEEGSNG